jgi:hypothetical protein
MTWATNWDTSAGEGKVLGYALSDLRYALNERCIAVGRTLPTGVTELYDGGIIQSSWFTWFQEEITELIPLYVNYIDSGGEWDGVGTIPNWTEVTILDVIGDARWEAPIDPKISAQWMYQQYQIINLLRWVQDDGELFGSQRLIGQTYLGVYDDTWNEVLVDWNALGWGAYGWVNSILQGTASQVNFDYFNEINNTRCNEVRASIQGTFEATADFYLYTEISPVPTYSMQYGSTDGFAEDKFNILGTQSTETSTTINKTIAVIMEDDNTKPINPDTGGNNGYTVGGTCTAVLKFDGANGFTYID